MPDQFHLEKNGARYLKLIMLLGLALHAALCFFSFVSTYDAYVHMFFADHYAKDWFSSWDNRWYTGFTVSSYPPLVHYGIALISKFVGLKGGFVLMSSLAILLFIRGVYKFSLIWFGELTALLAALLAVFSTSFTEALHIFGQLPSVTASALLLNACYEIYAWVRIGKRNLLFLSLAYIAVISSTHHVTTIFGMVFFVLPVIAAAIFDRITDAGKKPDFFAFVGEVWKNLKRLSTFGFLVLAITFLVIMPYWLWTRADPVIQVPIPHGSRDSFIEIFSSGLVFFLIPWSIMLFALPAILSGMLRKRNIFLAFSFVMLFILGTGGTTPIPKLLLGTTAFEILTLDRFTYWASLIAIPFFASFLQGLIQKIDGLRSYAASILRIKAYFLIAGILICFSLVAGIRFFKDLQPAQIEIEPITSFLEKDNHDQWRYLTMGFGDQMAWLSANTKAQSVDGNYHSVRRLPEMTSRAVERLENAKYQGEEGISSLREFLKNPEDYALKYIFSNDKFYDPLLYYSGWKRLQVLENDIVVWEKPNISPLSSIQYENQLPSYQRLMWGILPPATAIILLLLIVLVDYKKYKGLLAIQESSGHNSGKKRRSVQGLWMVALSILCIVLISSHNQSSSYNQNAKECIKEYFNLLDFKKFTASYELLHPQHRPDLSSYVKQLSLKGGILSTYAKLKDLDIDLKESEGESTATVEAHWTTALMEYTTHHDFVLSRKDGQWRIHNPPSDPQMPPDLIVSSQQLSYYSQGRRKPLMNLTEKRDIIDRPEVRVEQANLIKRESSYYVVGRIRNTDALPASVDVEAVFYNANNEEISSNRSLDLFDHFLLPEQSSVFRIEYQQKKNLEIQNEPSFALLFINTSVAAVDFSNPPGLRVSETQNGFNIEMQNNGVNEIIIPRVLYSISEQEELLWVDRHYFSASLKPQKSLKEEIDINNYKVSLIDRIEAQDILINGLDQNHYYEGGTLSRVKVPRASFENYNFDLYTNGYHLK